MRDALVAPGAALAEPFLRLARAAIAPVGRDAPGVVGAARRAAAVRAAEVAAAEALVLVRSGQTASGLTRRVAALAGIVAARLAADAVDTVPGDAGRGGGAGDPVELPGHAGALIAGPAGAAPVVREAGGRTGLLQPVAQEGLARGLAGGALDGGAAGAWRFRRVAARAGAVTRGVAAHAVDALARTAFPARGAGISEHLASDTGALDALVGRRAVGVVGAGGRALEGGPVAEVASTELVRRGSLGRRLAGASQGDDVAAGARLGAGRGTAEAVEARVSRGAGGRGRAAAGVEAFDGSHWAERVPAADGKERAVVQDHD